jgi:molybdopterin-guanine dinucleotide biosynthesis protein A
MDDYHGAIITCGGKSSRMGTSKAMLPFGPEAVLQRIVRIVHDAVSGPVVIVAARDQSLPQLPSEVAIVYDEHDALGPLEGLRVGLSTFRDGRSGNRAFSKIALAVSCDVPLLRLDFLIRLLVRLTPEFDAAVPRSAGFLHPLAAAYRIDTVLPHVERLVAERRLRATGLLDDLRTRILDEDELRTVDPDLESLRNMNTPDEYEALLRLAGFQPRTTDYGPRTKQ